MRREFGLQQIRQDTRSLLTVGSFDGVHIGHQEIIRYLVRRARSQGSRSVVLSFEPHPREVLTGEAMPLLTTVDEKAQVLKDLGLDRFIVVEFTREFANLEPEVFVEDILVRRIGLEEIVVGYDHGFGRGRKGNIQLLRRMGQEFKFSVDVIAARAVDEQVVSSRAIRRRISEEGDVRGARDMLGRPYAMGGSVVPGAGRGRSLGYPTANIAPNSANKVIPARGVYAVRAHFGTLVLGGMMNIGYRPTVGSGESLHLEAHLFDFAGNIYGQALQLSFIDRLRDEKKFDSLEHLRSQLQEDEQCSRVLLGASQS